ncbi:Methyltransf-11 domain-containing protein [Fusarium keratoplasticum]|nr:Methyltransf-11 domain-containing protein [Fusarium keratoplasticum]
MANLARSLNSSSVAETLATYESWAESYNEDIDKEEYTAPEIASDYVFKHMGSQKITSAAILDAGCGTGLVGQHLAKRGATQLDGIDLSPGMLQVARRTGIYRSLSVADLSQRLEIPGQSYDVVVCVGTLTQGHVGPGAFDSFVRVVKPGGLIVATVRESVWQKNGYEDKVKALDEEGKVKLVGDKLEMIGTDVRAVFVVLKAQ